MRGRLETTVLLAHAAHQLPFVAPVLITIVILTAIAIRDGRRHDAERIRRARTDERNSLGDQA